MVSHKNHNLSANDGFVIFLTSKQSPTLGAHTHAHAQTHPCPWVFGGHGFDIIVHGWAWVGIVSRWVWMGIAFKWVRNPCPSILLET